MTSEEIQHAARHYLMNTYAQQPIALIRGEAERVYDAEGREYLDFVSGIAVNLLGHCHEAVIGAIHAQASRLIHVSNLYYSEPQVRLARCLVNHSFADKVFFCNSGAEANEAAIKLVRQYAHKTHGAGRYEIIAMENSFHGRTLGSLTATGQPMFHTGFDPLVPGFTHVPFNDIAAIRKAVGPQTAGIFVEPIQGEGGVIEAELEYLQAVRALCTQHDSLLIFDEVQTGMGRTGRLFAYEHYEIEPDVMTLAKGLGGGVPIGACLATNRVARAFVPGMHGSTFGGNPLACAVALAVLTVLLKDDGVLQHCRRMGEYLRNGLSALQRRFPEVILGVSGRGLLLGMELAMDGKDIVDSCREKGLLINCTKGRVLRLLPPLTIADPQIDRLLDTLSMIFHERGTKVQA